LPDGNLEVWEAFSDGYWSLTSINGFSVADYNISLTGNGFTPADSLFDITRVIKRTTGAGDWEMDGVHSDAVIPVFNRLNLTGDISSSGTHYGLGKVRPRIIEQPRDTAICDGTDAWFAVRASGYPDLTYKWQIHDGSWVDINDGGVYSETDTDTLRITGADLTFDGFRYRVRILDGYNNPHPSAAAQLTVNPVPVITNTILSDTLCNDMSFHFDLESDVPGTTFAWMATADPGISGASDGSGDRIEGALYNVTDSIGKVIFTVLPTGPMSTYCSGSIRSPI